MKSNSIKKSKKQFTAVNVPAAISYKVKGQPPVINGRDGIRIHRCEFVGTATNGATTGFALTPLSLAMIGYDLNPSVATMFPWLSRVAACYERFRFNSVNFRFVPSQSTATAGRFYAAVDYDYDDAPATSKATLMGNHSVVESPVWQESKLVCDPSCLNRDMPYRYVSCTTKGLAIEQRTAFAGFLMLAFDTAVANLLMDIWVEYDVQLVTPVTDEFIVQELPCVEADMTSVAAVTTALGVGGAGAVPRSHAVMTSGPVATAVSGVNNVPIFAVPMLGSAAYATEVADISAAKGSGVLSLLFRWLETGVSPATLLAQSLTVVLAAHDYLGTYLGLLGTVSGLVHNSEGPLVLNEVSTNSKILAQQTTIDLHELINAYPTAHYLAPVLYNPNATNGAGKVGWGFHWSA